MEAYRKVASVQDDDQAQAVLDELTDRYGPAPDPVLNLLAVARALADGAMKGHRRPPAGGHARFGGADRLVRQTLRLAADVGRRV